jgi:phage terminase large subunit GpA-like protein
LSEKSNPGYIHFSDELGIEFFDQLTAEKYAAKYVRGRKIYEWINPNRARNEALDCTVYAYAAALKLGIHRWGENKWQQLENKLGAFQGDLFANISKKQTTTKKYTGVNPW